MAELTYAGHELDLFAEARNWKSYWRARIASYVGGDVLEVGAGIGANTELLADLDYDHWTCLEPDAALAGRIRLPGRAHESLTGTLDDVEASRRFDALLYIDVLEHIEDDAAEMSRAAGRLRPNGCLIVLAPAHPFLFTPFDKAIGHYRRYTRGMLRAVAPAGVREERIEYLDSAGMLASLGNRLLLRQSMPTAGQIGAWDTMLVPQSKWLDRLTLGHIGKSVLGIWRKAA